VPHLLLRLLGGYSPTHKELIKARIISANRGPSIFGWEDSGGHFGDTASSARRCCLVVIAPDSSALA
jgi:hypothetical protein